MLTERLRQGTRWLLDPLVKGLASIGLNANALTAIGCMLSVGVAVVIATGRLQLGGVLLIVAAAFDALDGSLARQMGGATRFGAFLDSVLDRVSESAVLLGVAWWYMGQPGMMEELLACVAILGSTLVSYTRARAEGLGIVCKVGFFTRVERAVVIIAGLILGLTVPALWLLAVGSLLTSVHRIVHVYQQTRGQAL